MTTTTTDIDETTKKKSKGKGKLVKGKLVGGQSNKVDIEV